MAMPVIPAQMKQRAIRKVPDASEEELQHKLHGARIGLYVGDAAEAAAGLMHQIRRAIRFGRQAEAGARNPQVLVIERIKQLPSKLEILLLGDVELFGERRIDVPEARTAQSWQADAGVAKLPGARIGWTVVGPEVLVAAEGRLERGRIDPISDALRLGTAPGKHRIADQVAAS